MSGFIKVRVWNFLLAIASIGPFYGVNYDPLTNQASVAIHEANQVVPASIIGNETGSTYATPVANRRAGTNILERTETSFELKLGFDKEVAADLFEKLVMQGIQIPAGDGCPKLDVILQNDTKIHPPRQDASTGTQITYSLLVRPAAV